MVKQAQSNERKYTVKRFGKHETIVSTILADGTEIGLRAGASVSWVVFNTETGKPNRSNGQMDSFKTKKVAQMQADYMNS